MKLHIDHRTVFETQYGMLGRKIAEFERVEDAQEYVRTMELTGTPAAMAVPCPNVVTGHEGTRYCALAESAVKQLEEERDDLTRIFELQRKRERSWIERWRQETGKHDCLPDYGAMLEWIMDKAEVAEAREGQLRAALERIERRRKPCATIVQMEEWEWDEVKTALLPAGGEESGEVEGGSDGLRQA